MKSIPAAPSAADLKSAIERAGGTLIIPDPTMRARRAYRRAIHSLLNGDLLRPERCLRYSGRDRGDLVMRIEAVSEDPPVKPEPQPIPIPANLRSCHPIIQATREHERKKGFIDTCDVTGVAHLKVFAASFRRCLLVLQAIITEAECRGYVAETGGRCKGLHITINGHPLEVTMYEEPTRTPHEPTKYEQERAQQYVKYGWSPRYAKYDHHPSGKLSVRTDHGTIGTFLASGGMRWRLEDRLWQVFERLEAKAAKAEARDQEWRRGQELARRAEERALEQARQRYFEQKRVDYLSNQVSRWRQAESTREFIAAARTKGSLTEEDRRWIDWAEGWASEMEPFNGGLAPGNFPDPRPEDLAPAYDRQGFNRWLSI